MYMLKEAQVYFESRVVILTKCSAMMNHLCIFMQGSAYYDARQLDFIYHFHLILSSEYFCTI